MLGSEWLWKRTLPGQVTPELQEHLATLERLRAQFPARHRKYDRVISAIVSELASRPAAASVSAQRDGAVISNLDNVRALILHLFHDALERQQKKFAGQVHSETDERSVRLTALLDATFELYKLHVPGMNAALRDSIHRRNLAENLTIEYMPLLMLDSEDLPRTFAEYLFWKFGNEATEQIIDIEYLKGPFKRGISLLPDKTREATISEKHRFEWGKLV